MMRSLYAGVSGLQNHQTRMDVIGNNISNVNTTGYKKDRVNFHDLISQRLQGASQPEVARGGANPQQVGLGMQVSAIDTLHLQGSLETTGKKDDLAIEGDGFFVLRDGDEHLYTRAGAFGIDAEGMLVNPANGMRVQGWQAETENGQTFIDTAASVEDLHIPVGGKDPARGTSEVFFASNLNKNTPVVPDDPTQEELREGTWRVSQDIFDEFGNTHELHLTFQRLEDEPNAWEVAVNILTDEEDPTLQQVSVGGVESADGETFIVQFANDGTLQEVRNPEGGAVDEGDLSVNVSFEVPEASIPTDPETGLPEAEQERQEFSLNLGEVGSFQDSMTQFSSQSTVRAFRQDGHGMGYLEDFQIDQRGVITGIYSNGVNRELGQVATANFTNPAGLEKDGDTNFRQTINSGEAAVGPALSEGRGEIISGALEMSNVDLSESFTDMIVTQRGFQANSRTIQTTDEMLQEVMALKR